MKTILRRQKRKMSIIIGRFKVPMMLHEYNFVNKKYFIYMNNELELLKRDTLFKQRVFQIE